MKYSSVKISNIHVFLLGIVLIFIFCNAHKAIAEEDGLNNQASYQIDFIDDLGDIPLMEGLRIAQNSLITFDKPDGRFTEIWVIAPQGGSFTDIEEYYRTALSALGWRALGGGQYRRADEQLAITMSDSDDVGIVGHAGAAQMFEKEQLFIRFTLGPSKK